MTTSLIKGVHPLADLFPMMSDEEISDLAADIKAHGLLHAIVIDSEGLLVDGRNRLRACELINVEPQIQRLNGADAAAFIVSANLARRNLTKGQQAMALAMIYPEPQQGKKRDPELLKKIEKLGKSPHAAEQRLSQARAVLRFSRALAQEVISGATPLNDALDRVKEAEQQSLSRENQLARLHEEAPDLFDLVSEERLPLDEAFAAFEQRKQDQEKLEENRRETFIRVAEGAYRNVIGFAVSEFADDLHTLLAADAKFRTQFMTRVRFNASEIEKILIGAQNLNDIAKKHTGEISS